MSPTSKKVSPRENLDVIAGYHSPQVDVEYRMNTNEAPEPPPPAFFAALKDAIDDVAFNRYPDLSAMELRSAVGAFHGVDGANVYCANGSNEVLQSIMLAYGGPGRAAVTFEPTYAMHSQIAKVCGAIVIEGERDDEFLIDKGEVERVLAEAAKIGPGNPFVTFICSPNNPTARLEPREMIETVLELAPGLVVVDEAYGQFAPWSALTLLNDYSNLVVIRTFSKTWSLAGLRLGYAISSPAIISALQSVSLPYHLDSIKQEAGKLALQFEPEMEARVARLIEERGRLIVGLNDLDVTICPSQANFILFRPNHGDSKVIWKDLVEKHSVLIRDVSSWPRLEGYLRVTVGTKAENDAFLQSLATVLG